MIQTKKAIESILKCQNEEKIDIPHVFLFHNDSEALALAAALMKKGFKPFIEPWFEAISAFRNEMFFGYRVGVKYEHLVPKSFYEKKLMNLK